MYNLSNFEIGFEPKLTFLSDGDKEKLYTSALKIIEETGMLVLHEDAVKLLKAAGSKVEDRSEGAWVKIPATLVEKARETVPNNIAMYDREGNHAMDLGGRRAYFGTGSDLMWSVDSRTMERHHTKLEDIKRAAKVCDALPNIDFIMSFAHPHDVTPSRSYLESFKAMSENCTKPIVNTAEGRRDLKAMWEISKALRGGEKELREKPYWIQYDEPISPLKHPFDSMDKLIFCAETGSPVIYSPAPIACSTAPMTVAGHTVQGLAESFFGMVVHQLAAPGAPFLMGVGAAVLDMATSQCSYNAPEYMMTYMAMVEMSKWLDIPNWGYGGTSDAQIPDMQASYEAGLEAFMSVFAGSNLNHDVGYLDFGLSGSLDMIVIVNEMIDQIRRMYKGIPVNDDTLALNVIPEGASQNQFLTHPHTFKHLRKVQWKPELFCRQSHDKWVAQGRTTLLDRARARLDEILKNHRPMPIASEKQKAIDKIVSQFD
ncbi:MttB8 [Desulfamplus magnetovallimortis]|uniref:MttB8 n=1 Tax=Desulfamplus magnetovallimortis TaxID=1246637 RepID=A0A1W1HBD1_9BACT|nr:trimethylamine methyltransferase family protein [Desulfamplus magnetovallimortis]SLM29811.1 MttB8 [Desulfamplus magnetovallimortis]